MADGAPKETIAAKFQQKRGITPDALDPEANSNPRRNFLKKALKLTLLAAGSAVLGGSSTPEPLQSKRPAAIKPDTKDNSEKTIERPLIPGWGKYESPAGYYIQLPPKMETEYSFNGYAYSATYQSPEGKGISVKVVPFKGDSLQEISLDGRHPLMAGYDWETANFNYDSRQGLLMERLIDPGSMPQPGAYAVIPAEQHALVIDFGAFSKDNPNVNKILLGLGVNKKLDPLKDLNFQNVTPTSNPNG